MRTNFFTICVIGTLDTLIHLLTHVFITTTGLLRFTENSPKNKEETY